jgi:hypothetical protein
MALRWPRLLRYLPAVLAVVFFLFYSYPFWSGMWFHKSTTEQDRLHHDLFLLFLHGEESGFFKYGVGAYVLDWPPVHALYELTEREPRFRDWRTPPKLRQSSFLPHYIERTGRLAGWYHCLLAALCAPLLYLILLPYLGRFSALLAALVCGLQPAFVRYAANAGQNISLVLFALLTLLALDRWRTRSSPGWAVLTGVFAACAFVNKEFFGYFMLAFPLVLWDRARKTETRWLSPHTVWLGVLALAAFVAVVAALSLVWLDPRLYLGHLKAYFVSAGAINPKWVDFWRPPTVSLTQYPALAWVGWAATLDSVPLLLLSAVGLYYAFAPKADRIWLLALPTAVYLVLVPVRYFHLNYPYLYLCLPFAAAAAAKGFAKLWSAGKWYWRAPAAALAALGLLQFAAVDGLMFHDMGDDVRVQVADFFNRMHCPPGYSVGTFDTGVYGPNNFGCGQLVGLNLQRTAHGERAAESPDYLVLSGEQLGFVRARNAAMKDAPLADAPRFLVEHGDYQLLHTFENPRRFLVYRLNGFNDPYYLFRNASGAP